MPIDLIAEITAAERTVATGSGGGRGPANLWRAGLHERARQPGLPLTPVPQLVGHQALLARTLGHDLPSPLARRGGARLAACCGTAPCTSAACPVCRTLGDAWLAGTVRRRLSARPHGWVAFGGLILDRDPIGALPAYTRDRLTAEFVGSLRALGLDHLDWHGRFAFSVQSHAATREDGITISVAAAATTGPFHDLAERFDAVPLGSALSFRAAVAVEAGAGGIADACRLAHGLWNVPTATQQGCARLSDLAAPPAHDLPEDLRAIELELAVAAHVATWGYRDLLLPASAVGFDHLVGTAWTPG